MAEDGFNPDKVQQINLTALHREAAMKGTPVPRPEPEGGDSKEPDPQAHKRKPRPYNPATQVAVQLNESVQALPIANQQEEPSDK